MTNPRRLDAADVRIVAALLAIPGLLYAEALTGQRVFYERDIVAYWYPKVEGFVRVLAQGSLPLWDPYAGLGQPLLADPGSQVYYPFTWLNLLLLPATVYTSSVVAHAWIAAGGTFVLGRAWSLSRPAAAVAAIVFAASGPFVSAASLYHHYMGAAWMPWVLLALERALERPTRGRAAALAALAGVQILAGSGDMVVLTALAGSFRLLGALDRGAIPRLSLRVLAGLGVAGALGLALAAAQWVPTLELLRRSSRSAMPAGSNLYWSVHPLALTELVLPQALVGLPLSEGARAILFESREPFLPSLYLGLFPALVLVPLAATASRRRAAIAAGAALFFLVAALGRHTVVLPLLSRVLGFSWFRYPVKYTVALALFWALLAGLGLDAWRASPSPGDRRRAWILAALALAVAAGTLGLAEWVRVHARELGAWVDAPPEWRPSAYAPLVHLLRRAALIASLATLCLVWRARAAKALPTAVLVTLVAADIVSAGRAVNDLAPRALLSSRPPVLRLIGDPPDAHRLYTVPVSPVWLNRALVRGPAGWKQSWSWALGLQESLQPPIAARWGFRGSYEADYTGLASAPLPTVSALVARYLESAIGLRVLRMAGVTDVVALRPLSAPGLVLVGEVPTVFSHPVRLMRVPSPMPFAYVVGEARAAAGDAALQALGDPSFDPGRTVLLESVSAPQGSAAFAGRADVVEARPDRWVLRTETSGPGYVVTLDGNDPGWRATVDGREAPVRRANILFRAVEVPAGAHLVEMRYRPRSVVVGLGVSALALLTLVALAAPRVPRRSDVAAAADAGLRSPAPEGRSR